MAQIWSPTAKNEVFKQKYVCLWADENGWLVQNEDREFLCAESFTKGDPKVEFNMRGYVKALGIHGGQPIWREGEKISTMEWEDQMERYIDGKIPDPKEEYRARVEDALEDKEGGGTTGITR